MVLLLAALDILRIVFDLPANLNYPLG